MEFVDDTCIVDFMDFGHYSNNHYNHYNHYNHDNHYTNSVVARSTEDDGVSILDLPNLGHDSIGNNDSVLRPIEEDVYITDSVNLGYNNMQNNSPRILGSSEDEDGDFIFDSMNLVSNHYAENNVGISRMNPANNDSDKNLERFISEEKTEESCSICLGELQFGSRPIRMPQPCSHIFHKDCITEWLNISHTCPLCRRTI